MNQETIKRFIEEAHGNAVEKGFYPEGEDKNIGELLMLIVSELGEALEAHRCGSFCRESWLDDFFKENYTPRKIIDFESFVKDTFEDEIADVFIRLFDLCGYLNIFPDYPDHNIYTKYDNFAEQLLFINKCVHRYSEEYPSRWAGEFLLVLAIFTQQYNIPIQKHIEAKMTYNRTRPHKHGKEY